MSRISWLIALTAVAIVCRGHALTLQSFNWEYRVATNSESYILYKTVNLHSVATIRVSSSLDKSMGQDVTVAIPLVTITKQDPPKPVKENKTTRKKGKAKAPAEPVAPTPALPDAAAPEPTEIIKITDKFLILPDNVTRAGEADQFRNAAVALINAKIIVKLWYLTGGPSLINGRGEIWTVLSNMTYVLRRKPIDDAFKRDGLAIDYEKFGLTLPQENSDVVIGYVKSENYFPVPPKFVALAEFLKIPLVPDPDLVVDDN